MQRFGNAKKVNLHPDTIDNFTMGTIFEELIRKFNEALNENPGEHFTPRDVVHLMVDLMLAGDEEELRRKGVARSVYDPCCGSGGMLTIAKEHTNLGEIREGKCLAEPVNPDADIHLFGQEVNPETFAICNSDFFMKSRDGRDAKRVLFGSTLSNDRGAARKKDEAEGGEKQAAIRALLQNLPNRLFLERAAFESEFSRATQTAGLKPTAPIKRAMLTALSERNPEAAIRRDRKGRPEPDPQLRDTEKVPLGTERQTARALELLVRHPGLPARDALHVATMEAHGVERLLSADRHFDQIDTVMRVDPLAPS